MQLNPRNLLEPDQQPSHTDNQVIAALCAQGYNQDEI
jgi:hypothetical protein